MIKIIDRVHKIKFFKTFAIKNHSFFFIIFSLAYGLAILYLTKLKFHFLLPRQVCDEDQSYIFLLPVQLGMYLAYLLIFLVGVVGNMLVLVVVFTNSHMQTTTNMYLVNLSAADILMCLGMKWG